MMSGTALRDAGIARALSNPTTPPWKVVARDVIIELARVGAPFTAEDVRHFAGDPPAGAPNTMGAMLRTAAVKGIIRREGIGTSTRPSSHARMMTRWIGVADFDPDIWSIADGEGLGDQPPVAVGQMSMFEGGTD